MMKSETLGWFVVTTVSIWRFLSVLITHSYGLMNPIGKNNKNIPYSRLYNQRKE
jgi:hypothetical protein